MATFVLVHGAWHGGWCYQRVARLLQEAGHDVFTPTLTGMATRTHPAGLEVNLDTHIRDIVQLLVDEDLAEIVLCGHSYGGLVVTGVAAELPRRIRSLVYLDAFVPGSGQSFLDLVSPEIARWFRALAATHGGLVPPLPAASYNVNSADAAWVDAMCVAQPLACFTQALPKGVDAIDVASRTYIFASANGMDTFRPVRDRLAGDGSWTVHDMPCGHEIMLDDPAGLARLLLAGL